MIDIIISVDYEIYGNGKGDVIDHMINPTAEMTKILDVYDVPLTIFLEISELIKFYEYDSALSNDLGYSPFHLIKKQMEKAYIKGHSIEMHLHPQWLDASYKQRKWKMSSDRRSIKEFSVSQLSKWLTLSESFVSDFVLDSCPTHKFTCLRSTNMDFTEAPENLVEVLEKSSIKLHSYADYSHPKAFKKGYWPLSDNVFEIPIFSQKKSFIESLSLKRIQAYLYNSYNGMMNKKKTNFRNRLGSYGNTGHLKWDFCKQSSKEMISFLDFAINFFQHKGIHFPLVMIGHSKDFFNEKEFENFVKKVKTEYSDVCNFSTFSKFLEFIN